ncbi:MAG: sugar phosphate nucleotidyltransferase [Bdellovibrionia bacterium]
MLTAAEPSAPVQMVILAGGLGTCLRPLTERYPKSMIPVLEKPFIDHQLKPLASSGIQEVILSTGYLGERIEAFVGDEKKRGLPIHTVDEGPNLRGTAGALSWVYDQNLLHDRFLLTSGDFYLPVDYAQLWRAFQSESAPALTSVLKNSSQWDTRNACFDGKRVTLDDKRIQPKPKDMLLNDYGLSAFQKEHTQRFYEIRSLQGIQDLEEYLA